MSENGAIRLPTKEDTFLKVEDQDGKLLAEIDIVEAQLKIDEVSSGKTTNQWVPDWKKWIEGVLKVEIPTSAAWTLALEVQKRFDDYKKKLSPGVQSLIGTDSTHSKDPLPELKE